MVAVLRPIWETGTETGGHVRGRMEHILDHARTQEGREGERPARMKERLSHILPVPSTVAQVEHDAALHYAEIVLVMARMAHSTGIGAMAVRFAFFTAARPRRCVTPSGRSHPPRRPRALGPCARPYRGGSGPDAGWKDQEAAVLGVRLPSGPGSAGSTASAAAAG